MTRKIPARSEAAFEAADNATLDGRELFAVIVRCTIALSVVLLMALALGHFARQPCEALARAFVANYGYAGMALGTLLADGLHFPIPPQFYMFVACASRAPVLHSFAAIAVGSLLAGWVGYAAANLASRLPWVQTHTARAQALLGRVYRRFGLRSALLASLLPIPYSVVCYVAGLHRLPRAFLALLCLCRVPKLAGFYLLVYLGWQPD